MLDDDSYGHIDDSTITAGDVFNFPGIHEKFQQKAMIVVYFGEFFFKM